MLANISDDEKNQDIIQEMFRTNFIVRGQINILAQICPSVESKLE